MPLSHALLARSTTTSSIVDWGGATTRAAMAATVKLFNAVSRHDLPEVHRQLDLGARVNARRRHHAMPEGRMTQSPLELALWLEGHGPDDQRIGPTFRDDSTPVTTGIAEALVAAGATTLLEPRDLFRGLAWGQHPACRALEESHLSTPDLERWTQRFSKAARRQGRCVSVMPDHPEEGAHSWLHRALVHQRWDVVQAWVDQGLALNFKGSESVCALMVDRYFNEPDPVRAQTLLDGLDLLRPGLLVEDEDAYQGEVRCAVSAIAHYAPPPFTDTILEKSQTLIDWVGDLILQRSTPCTLSDKEIDPGPQGMVMLQIMRELEARVLRATTPTPDRAVPARRRL